MPAGVTPIEMPAERRGATARDRLMCRSLLIPANARRRQQGKRHAHPFVRVLAGGSDVDRKLLMAETLVA